VSWERICYEKQKINLFRSERMKGILCYTGQFTGNYGRARHRDEIFCHRYGAGQQRESNTLVVTQPKV
jgi:hypothetical protein